MSQRNNGRVIFGEVTETGVGRGACSVLAAQARVWQEISV